MSKNSKKDNMDRKDSFKFKEDLSYEEAFDRLKDIVDKMQQENVSLDETIKLYKEGKILSERCSNLLDEAKFEIENIMKDSNDISK